MTETSTTYRWRPRLKVVVVDAWAIALAAFVFIATLAIVITDEVIVRHSNRRAVAVMVREDAREMVALAEKHIPWRFENVARDRVTCESQGITVLRVGDAVFVTARKEGVR